MKRIPIMVSGIIAWAMGAAPVVPADSSPNVPIPPAAEIVSKLRPEHPRLLARAQDFRGLRERINGSVQLKSWHQSLRGSADRILAAKPSKYEIPDGLRLLSTSRRVVDRMQTLGMA